jgi:hypothetical protein
MENCKAKTGTLRRLKTAAILILVLVFLIYFLPSDFTGSFFTDRDSDTAAFTVDPFNCACFCVLTDFCGGKWLIVNIPEQPGFDPDGLSCPPAIYINGTVYRRNPDYPEGRLLAALLGVDRLLRLYR